MYLKNSFSERKITSIKMLPLGLNLKFFSWHSHFISINSTISHPPLPSPPSCVQLFGMLIGSSFAFPTMGAEWKELLAAHQSAYTMVDTLLSCFTWQLICWHYIQFLRFHISYTFTAGCLNPAHWKENWISHTIARFLMDQEACNLLHCIFPTLMFVFIAWKCMLHNSAFCTQ